jgi:fructokinase
MSVLVVGESLVDVVERRTGGVGRHPGGSPANVAVGLARLGHEVTLVTRIGDDDDGTLLLRHIEADGVRLAPGSVVAARTSTATATLDETGAATYTFDLDWQLPAVDLSGVRHVHAGSIGAALPPGGEAVRRLVAEAASAGISTSYDPNLRPGLIRAADVERATVEQLVDTVDVVKASDADLAWLYADENGAGEPVAAAARWAGRGPRLVVLTQGARGALACLRGHADAPLFLPAPRIAVVDTVGAGDAFMAGLLSGLLDAGLIATAGSPQSSARTGSWSPDDVRPALLRALEVSALTCTRPGADPPRRAEL